MELAVIVGFIVAVAFPLSVSFIGALFSSGGDSDWYKQLKKPPWTPPNWAFPVVWSILYILMGVSSWLVWRHGGFKGQSLPLAVYAFQLILNFLWTPLFFGLHQVGLALFEILLLWTSIVGTIYVFWHVTPLAAYLLVPYIVWRILALQAMSDIKDAPRDDCSTYSQLVKKLKWQSLSIKLGSLYSLQRLLMAVEIIKLIAN